MISPELAARIAAGTNVDLRPAEPAVVEALQAAGLPASVVAFYQSYEPAEFAEINGVRLLPGIDLLEENRDFVPGADLYPHGFVVFATTDTGDAYCLDLSEHGAAVVLMSHELSFSEMPVTTIRALRKRIAADFDEFLSAFAAGTLDTEPLYAPTEGQPPN